MRKKLLIALAIIVVCFGISSGYIFDGDGKAAAEIEPVITLTMPQAIARDTYAKYGSDIVIVQGPEAVKAPYLVYWTDAAGIRLHVVLWLNGVPVEVASVPLATPAPTVTPAGE